MQTTTAGSILYLSGHFDVRSTFQVRSALYEHMERVGDDVIVDLSDVESVDVTALKVLAMATRQAHREGHRLVLRGSRPAVLRMLHMSRLIRIVEVDRPAVTA